VATGWLTAGTVFPGMTHALQKINIPNSKIAKIVGIFLRMFFLKGYLEKDRYKYWYSILIHSGCWIHGTRVSPLYFRLARG
jgi:hypothetical protein